MPIAVYMHKARGGVMPSIAPVIAEVVSLLQAQPGVTMARMSGSGATCFALFETEAARDAADAAVATQAPHWWRMATVLA